MSRRGGERQGHSAHARAWIVALAAGLVAVAAEVAGSFGDIHSAAIRPRVIGWSAALALAIFGVVAIRRVAWILGHSIATRDLPTAGAAVKVVVSGLGYTVLVVAELGLLSVPVERLLLGAGLAGVVLGIAAQQSLGNIFAALVLIVARPFSVGERIRIRSGALGGVFEAEVLNLSLTYVTLRTAEGELKIPNSAMLAAGIGHLDDPAPLAEGASPPSRTPPPAM